MNPPELPSKTVIGDSSKIHRNIPLPTNCHLLSTLELQQLIASKDRLQQYVTQFSYDNNMKDKVLESKNKLMELNHKFELLAKEKIILQEELINYNELKSQYNAKWQQLDKLMREHVGDQALKKKLKVQMIDFDNKSKSLYSSVDPNTVDQFIDEYTHLRTQYHICKEKLLTWEYQNKLISRTG